MMSHLHQSLHRVGLAALSMLLLAIAPPALAGEFFERNGVAIDGYDPVAYIAEGKPVRGSQVFKAEYKGSPFHFASAANRDKFQASPETYAPQFGGFCAYGAAGGYKAKIEPDAFTVSGGKLYLNYNASVQASWRKDIPGYIAKAERRWPDVSKQTKVTQ